MVQVARIKIDSAFDGVASRPLAIKLTNFLRGRAVRRNREEADLARTRTEDGDIIWGTGQVGGRTR